MKLKSNLRLTCLALGALALSSVALHAANTPKAANERGTIKSVDAAARTVVVTDLKNKTEHTFLWNDHTKFTERGKTATAADLKPGERVRITYSGRGEQSTMQRVHIAPPKTERSANEKS